MERRDTGVDMAEGNLMASRRLLTIPHEVVEGLGFYVYVLRDPRDGSVFYVGKGLGQRVYSHVNLALSGKSDPALDAAKITRIKAIVASGQDVEHLFVSTNIADEDTAYMIEQAVIDGLRANGQDLTNLQSGRHSRGKGLATVSDAIARLGAEAAPPLPPGSVVFLINRAWRPGDGVEAVYKATHGHWVIGAGSRAKAKQAFGVSFGIIRGVFDIQNWYPDPTRERRWGFNGVPSVRYWDYVGRHMRNTMQEFGNGSQYPVRLFL